MGLLFFWGTIFSSSSITIENIRRKEEIHPYLSSNFSQLKNEISFQENCFFRLCPSLCSTLFHSRVGIFSYKFIYPFFESFSSLFFHFGRVLLPKDSIFSIDDILFLMKRAHKMKKLRNQKTPGKRKMIRAL